MRNAEVVGLFHRAQEFGITVAEWSADYAQAVQRSRRVADRMAKGVEFLFRKNKITLYAGVGVLTGRNTVEVKGTDGAQTLEGKAIILATGSEPKSLPGVALDEKQVISSNGAVRSEDASRFASANPLIARGSRVGLPGRRGMVHGISPSRLDQRGLPLGVCPYIFLWAAAKLPKVGELCWSTDQRRQPA